MSKTIEVKTNELEGAALDWAVAKVEGWEVEILPEGLYRDASTGRKTKATGYRLWMVSDVEPCECTPSSAWSQGGPLIEKSRIELTFLREQEWIAFTFDAEYEAGATPLIAACRAIVAAKLGDTVQIPSELA
ncbi:phage protein NinX family protein [Pseudomonas luteola]